ncbi:MAG: YciI family protein [Cyclobacteriaceae bacterium]|jgi:hypothetical protein|nr:YciI family protein [Cyclobacteriaceae bacterium]
MKEYLLLFWNDTGEGKYLVSAEKMQENMAAWQNWIGNLALNGHLIATKPITWEGSMVSNKGIKQQPAIKEKQMVTGYLICKAKELEEVQTWAKTCPILAYENGFTEIREITAFEM